VPDIEADLAEQVVRVVGTLRALELKKSPAVSETIDWARTLLALGIGKLDDAATAATLGVVLKHQSDLLRAAKELGL
jgi:MoxR-like ATPase